MYKIVTVCGMGVGTSLILKMSIEKAMEELGRKCTVEHWDMGTVKGKDYDLLVTTPGFKKNFQDQDNVIYIDSVVDNAEIKNKLEKYFEDNE